MTLDPRNPQPGVYDGVDAETYHALDLISASGLCTIDAECPALYRAERDTPSNDDEKWDMGTAAHVLILEGDDFARKVERLDVDSWQTKAAREARAQARVEGRVALKARDYDTILAMREALRSQVGDLFTGGFPERTYIWRDPRTGVLAKARLDYVRPGLILDYKTSGSANPRAFRARCFDCGHHIQAWLYLMAHDLMTGETASWRWIVQSTKPPYLVTAHKPTPSLLSWAAQQATAALQTYARCLREQSWPGYGDHVHVVELPTWATYQLAERFEAGDFRLDQPPAKKKKALTPAQVQQGMAAFSPLNGGLK